MRFDYNTDKLIYELISYLFRTSLVHTGSFWWNHLLATNFGQSGFSSFTSK